MKNKAYRKSLEKIDKEKVYPVKEALELVLQASFAKFDESVDVAVSLGVDVKQTDQQIRGALSLPHGLGKTVRVLAFVNSDTEQEALKAGADFCGGKDLTEKIKGGWLDFDRVVATPDMMPVVAQVAKILGPKGLMPSPKTGTVTPKPGAVIEAEKKGRVNFRSDKAGIIHASIGKKSMGLPALEENYQALLEEIVKSKPSSSKGVYLKKISLSSTMSPSAQVSTTQQGQKVS